VTEVLAKEGEQMKVGDVIARMETDIEEDSPSADDEAHHADPTSSSRKKGETVEAGDRVSDSPDRKAARRANEKAARRKRGLAGNPNRRSCRKRRPKLALTDAEKAIPTASRYRRRHPVRRLARELGVDIRGISGTGPWRPDQ
jgi:pyruvate/2-oxoglutarate dehydrogenase complex dihydrolipoamide acyltransferase (E2) component